MLVLLLLLVGASFISSGASLFVGLCVCESILARQIFREPSRESGRKEGMKGEFNWSEGEKRLFAMVVVVGGGIVWALAWRLRSSELARIDIGDFFLSRLALESTTKRKAGFQDGAGRET